MAMKIQDNAPPSQRRLGDTGYRGGGAIVGRIHERRKEPEIALSIAGLAREIGISTSTLEYRLSRKGGDTAIPATLILPLALALRVDPLWLLCVPDVDREGVRELERTVDARLGAIRGRMGDIRAAAAALLELADRFDPPHDTT